ncbi:hypothetical protein EK21DRAFT_12931, partial [Setomelanomma holmii]
RLKRNSPTQYYEELNYLLRSKGFPQAWHIRNNILKIHNLLDREMQRINDAWQAEVEKQWVGEPIAVESVSSPIDTPSGDECITCGDEITTSDVRTPCGHQYCRKCLETWIHACQPASHRCPYCRTELFEKPQY